MIKFINKYERYISIIFLLTSITLLVIGIFTKNLENKSIYIIFGEILCIAGILVEFIEYKENKPQRRFELVSEKNKKTNNTHVILPQRATANSAAYDFYSNISCVVEPNEVVKIWTDIKAYMQPDEFLMLNVRSSMGGKFMLANTIGIVDSDYVDNENNEGNICIVLKNISDEPQIIEKGTKIAQAIFVKYLTIDNDNTNIKRIGGFGSSGK